MVNPVSESVEKVARRYDRVTAFYSLVFAPLLITRHVRRAAVDALGLSAGMRVLEVGCGSGLDLPLLVDAVESAGLVYGVDVSAGMLERAGRLVAKRGWSNVQLRNADAAQLTEPTDLDGVLFGFSYAILPEPAVTLAAAWRLLRPGGRLVIAEGHLPDHWLGRLLRRPALSISKRTVLGDPDNRGWEDLARLGSDVTTRKLQFGTFYVATAVKRPDASD